MTDVTMNENEQKIPDANIRPSHTPKIPAEPHKVKVNHTACLL